VSRDTIQKIRVEQISPNPNQARIDFDEQAADFHVNPIFSKYSYDLIEPHSEKDLTISDYMPK